jgi:hypothetical protein
LSGAISLDTDIRFFSFLLSTLSLNVPPKTAFVEAFGLADAEDDAVSKRYVPSFVPH